MEGSLSPGAEAPGVRDRERPAAARTPAKRFHQAGSDSAAPGKEESGMSPFAPAHPCGFPGCPILVDPAHRRCEKHRVQERKEADQRRGSAARRGYDAGWRAARRRYLILHPLCVECERVGRLTAAAVVDHVVPHKGNASLFWDETNWQALCEHHHAVKTAAEDGGFGNRLSI